MIYRVSIKSFADYKHLLQENYVEYKHTFYNYLCVCSLPSWESWGNTASGQHVQSAQTPEEKTFWNSLSDSVNAVSVSANVSVKAETVLV
jgi:hypothetical protein